MENRIETGRFNFSSLLLGFCASSNECNAVVVSMFDVRCRRSIANALILNIKIT